MCIYCGTDKYRQIYKNHHGPVPKDEDGRSYEIHHIDGNHSNNDPNNLKCVTIKEHYDIHYSQEDYGACWFMARRMKLSPEEISNLARLNANKRVENGTHNFLGGEVSRKINVARVKNGTHNFLGGKIQKKRVNEGTHNFLGGEIQRSNAKKQVAHGTHPFLGGEVQRKNARKRMENGTHNFIGLNERRIKEGTHNFLGGEAARKSNKIRMENGTHHFLNQQGSKNHNYDHTIYRFKHRLTDEIVEMTQFEFVKKYNLNAGNVNAMVRKNKKVKSVKNWIILD